MKLAHWMSMAVVTLGLAMIVNTAEAAPCREGSACARSGTLAKTATPSNRKANTRKSAQRLATKRRLGARSATYQNRQDQEFSLGNEQNRSLNKRRFNGKGGSPAALIRSMAPSYGVPGWFAVRIATVESSLRPGVRGAAGEYGLFQLKCTTARGLGFRGGCGQLLDARTNIRFGLKHLQQAIRSSRGNLKLAASKHNGGLGRKSLVPRYVRKVFS
jgi:soluble lytic murein transglycosylase-like protein